MTGSAHCALAPYWFSKISKLEGVVPGKEGMPGISKSILSGYQASIRGGQVHVALSDSGKRVLLSGSSVTVIQSKILV